MGIIKTLSIAVGTSLVIAAVAVFGVASADSLCTVNVGHSNECPAHGRVAEGANITGATAGKTFIFLNSAKEAIMVCRSNILGTVGANEGKHQGLRALLTSLTITECEGLCPKGNSHSAPFSLLAVASTLLLHVLKHDATGLKFGFLLEACTIFKINCLHEIEGDSALLILNGDTWTLSNVPFVRSGHSGLCPAKLFVDTAYLMRIEDQGIAKDPVFLAALP